jgi:Ran GTPase-activating protein 1
MASGTVFSLQGRSLKLDTAEHIAPHIADLKNNPDVVDIRFSGNTLGVGACEALAEVLKTKSKLQTVDFADIFTARLLNEIPPALDALLKGLLNLPDLHTVNLSDNAFGLNTVEPLLSFLSEHAPLQHLWLNNNGLGPIAGTKIAAALASLAEKKKEAGAPPLQTVVCGRNRLENGSMEAWAKAFSLHTGVTHVRMVQNGIRQEGITLLLKNGLSHVPGLQVLDLEDNTFTAMGGRALADNIDRWVALEELSLNDCYLTARGWAMVAESLRKGKNVRLELLQAQFNGIDSKGVQLLADIQSALPKLRRVELDGNKFGEEEVSVDRIRETLEERREAAGGKEGDYGLGDLDDLESVGDESEEEEGADEGEAEVKRADEAEAENVAEEKDEKVDELADMLKKTGI